MLSSIDLMLTKAYHQKYAIPHFNINNLEFAKYILEACEEVSSPVIIGVSESAIKYMGGYNVVAKMVQSLITDLELTIPVGLLLDHGSSFESCEHALAADFNGVMINADNSVINEHIELTKKIVELAEKYNAYVEGEVGHIGSAEQTGTATDVNDAILLAKSTKINALAPSLGSVHGIYQSAANIDFDKMVMLNDNIKLPLVMHGGSGLPDHIIIKSIENGVAKINVNTDFQIAWAQAIKKYIENNPNVYDPRKIIGAGQSAIKEVAKQKILLFGSNYKS